MVVEFTTTYAISTDHHKSCEFEPRSWRSVLDTTFCDNVYLWVLPVSSTKKKTDRHDITEILLKVALNTINIAKPIIRSISDIHIFIQRVVSYNQHVADVYLLKYLSGIYRHSVFVLAMIILISVRRWSLEFMPIYVDFHWVFVQWNEEKPYQHLN